MNEIRHESDSRNKRCSDEWTSVSITKFDCEVEITSVQEDSESSNWVGFWISWYNL